MKIELKEIGQRYNKQWIFKNLNYTIDTNSCIAITGTNGSGKSTLLRILSNYQTATRGEINFFLDGINLNETQIILNTAYVGPYLNLVEELTLDEHLDFHFTFRNPIIPKEDIIIKSGLGAARNKPINEFSSGMKQRLRLALGFFSEAKLLLLDEPTSNMDENGIAWYEDEMKQQLGAKTIIIASNQEYEYKMTEILLEIGRFTS